MFLTRFTLENKFLFQIVIFVFFFIFGRFSYFFLYFCRHPKIPLWTCRQNSLSTFLSTNLIRHSHKRRLDPLTILVSLDLHYLTITAPLVHERLSMTRTQFRGAA